MASNPSPQGLGGPFFPPSPFAARVPPPPRRAPSPPTQAPPPPRRAPPTPSPPMPLPPPRRAPPPPSPPTQPPPPPRRAPPPPSPPTQPPPPPRRAPPPPSPPTQPPPPPRRAPPPPSPPIQPPPPPRRAPPPPTPRPNPPTPPPPPPSPPNHIIIIVVFVSLGGLLLLAFLAAALFCWHKKKKGRKAESKAEVTNFKDHVHVNKAIMSCPNGRKAELLSVDEDLKYQEAAKKHEVMGEVSSTALGARPSRHSPWIWHKQEGREAEQKAEMMNVKEHIHVNEAIIPGYHGQKVVLLSADEDITFEEADKEEEAACEASKTHI